MTSGFSTRTPQQALAALLDRYAPPRLLVALINSALLVFRTPYLSRLVALYVELDDRANLLIQLANLPEHPESVPINMLVKVAGTPMENAEDIDPFDFIRMLAVARIMMPLSHVRLSAGREAMNEQMQALAFFAGANSIFYGDKLLTTANPQADKDMQLFSRLGILPEEREDHADEVHQAVIEHALRDQKSSEQFYNAVV